jgi:phosphotransferase system HPr-like phosphotransfer protein
MSSSIKKLKTWLSVDLTLADEIRRGERGLDEGEARFVRALMGDGESISSYIDADATHAKNILKKLLGAPPDDVAYTEARRRAVAGTGDLLPIPVDEGLLDTLLDELNGHDHHKGKLNIAAMLDTSNRMLLTGTWNGFSHYGIEREIESALGPMPELIKLSIEHSEGMDEVRIVYFDHRALGSFKPFRWFAGLTEENIFVLSRPQPLRRETRLILAHARGLSTQAIGFLGTLMREFPDTRLLLCTREREIDIEHSVIALMMMPLKMGDEVRIVAAGPNADEVIKRIDNFASSGAVFLKAEGVSAPSKPSRSKSVDVIVNEEQGVHFRVISGLLGLVKACEGTKLYLTMHGVERMDVSRSFSRLCSIGILSNTRMRLSAEGLEAATLIERILDFKLDGKNPVFSLCRPVGKKGPSGDEGPDGGTTPPSGGHAPSGGNAPSSSFKGIARSSDNAKAADCAFYDMAAAETLQQESFGLAAYDPIVLSAATFAARAACTI